MEKLTLDELVLFTSHHFTWISGFGFWDDECHDIENDNEQCETKIWQTYEGLKKSISKREFHCSHKKKND